MFVFCVSSKLLWQINRIIIIQHIETNSKKITEQPVDNNLNKNNNGAYVNIDNNRNNNDIDEDSDSEIELT